MASPDSTTGDSIQKTEESQTPQISSGPITVEASTKEEDPEAASVEREGLPTESTTEQGIEELSDELMASEGDSSPPASAAVVEPQKASPTAKQATETLARPVTPINKGKQVDSAPPASESIEPMSASALTIRPSANGSSNDASQQYLTPEPSSYVDPTPATPMTSQPPSRSPSSAARSTRSDDASPSRSNTDTEDKKYTSEDDREGGSQSEIQSIMSQFSEFGGGPDADEVMSPRLEIASPMLGGPIQHPPRKSSLEPLAPSIAGQLQEFNALRISTSSPTSVRSKEPLSEEQAPPVPPKDGTFGTPPRHRGSTVASPTSPQLSMHRPPPPEPEPESTQPFDFHRFLEQLRNKKADPVARYLKSFLTEFGKRQWMVHEQVKIISDFLAFIANKMMLCEVWRDVSDAEFDNAREGMEKLVMNRLYSQTFSPAIPAPKPIPGAKPKRKGGEPPLGPGRRGQHQEDVERDDIVTQKINIYGWVKEDHLDIPQIGDSGRRFLKLAQQELLKIKSYRAPRDKIICVLNCCKVIFGLLKHNKSDSSADSFMPLLIYVVLQSNPEHLVSNVQYILRFRNQDRLGGEAGYYLSSLMGAIQFIENMDRTSLTITDEDFEKNVEAAVSAIAERHQALSPVVKQDATFSEKQTYGVDFSQDRPSTPRQSTDEPGDNSSTPAPISGLLRTIQKPLSTIGRMFTEDTSSQSASPAPRSPNPDNNPSPRFSEEGNNLGDVRDTARQPSVSSTRHALSAEEAAARQASAETAEAQRLQRAEHANVVETLAGMFPDLDKDIISDVVYQKEGRVGLAVDACLALST